MTGKEALAPFIKSLGSKWYFANKGCYKEIRKERNREIVRERKIDKIIFLTWSSDQVKKAPGDSLIPNPAVSFLNCSYFSGEKNKLVTTFILS